MFIKVLFRNFWNFFLLATSANTTNGIDSAAQRVWTLKKHINYALAKCKDGSELSHAFSNDHAVFDEIEFGNLKTLLEKSRQIQHIDLNQAVFKSKLSRLKIQSYLTIYWILLKKSQQLYKLFY